jgi:hypothetical protein
MMQVLHSPRYFEPQPTSLSYGIKSCRIEVSCIISLQSFIQICRPVQNLLGGHTDTYIQTDGQTCDLISLLSFLECKLKLYKFKMSMWFYAQPRMSRCQKAGQRQIIKIGNRSFESVAKSKYLGTTLTDQICVHEEIKSRLNSGNACYHLVQSLLSSRLLSRNVKVKI